METTFEEPQYYPPGYEITVRQMKERGWERRDKDTWTTPHGLVLKMRLVADYFGEWAHCTFEVLSCAQKSAVRKAS